jgi:hypothetical protein
LRRTAPESDQTRADYAPWRTAGASAVTALTNAYGLNGSTNPGPVGTEQGQPVSGAYGGFFTSPGYQFRRDEGLKAIDRGAAARGALTGSGATIKAEQRYGDGLAASEYDAYTSRLAQLAGLGQSATAGTAAAGSTAAGNISSALINSGNARASSYTNTASAINSGLNNVMSAYLMQGMMKPPASRPEAQYNGRSRTLRDHPIRRSRHHRSVPERAAQPHPDDVRAKAA